MPISTYTNGIGDAFRSIGEYASGLVAPTVRLGVTGLARSGKTVFITALVHNLIAGARLPFFDPAAEGRLVRAYLEPQPDDVVPRFDYETSSRRSHRLAAALAREHAAHQPAQADARIFIAKILEAAARPRPPAYRHRRLSRRVAARSSPAPPRLSRMVARGTRAGRRIRPQEGLQGVAEGDRRDRPERPRRRGARGEALDHRSRPISPRHVQTNMRSRRCLPGASSCRASWKDRRLSPSPRSIPARRRASRAARCGG